MSAITAISSSIITRVSYPAPVQLPKYEEAIPTVAPAAPVRKITDDGSLAPTLSSDVLSTILKMVHEVSAAPAASNELFSRIDTDGNGSISKQEFIDARPDFATVEQASARFEIMDNDQSGTLSGGELKAPPAGGKGAQGAGGHPPPPPPPPGGGGGGGPGGGAGASTSELYDEMDTNEDGKVSIQELMNGLAKKAEDENTSSFSVTFQKALKAYAVYAPELLS